MFSERLNGKCQMKINGSRKSKMPIFEKILQQNRKSKWSAEHYCTVPLYFSRDYKNPAEARFGLRRYFDHYNHRRRHRSLGRKTPAAVYGLAKKKDFGMIKTDGGRSAVDSALASVALRAPSPRAG